MDNGQLTTKNLTTDDTDSTDGDESDLFVQAGRAIADVFLRVREKLELYGGPCQGGSSQVLHETAGELFLAGVEIEGWLHTIRYVMAGKGIPVPGTPTSSEADASALEGGTRGPVCRDCGCTDHRACWDTRAEQHCHWVEADLCSVCHHRRAVMTDLDGEITAGTAAAPQAIVPHYLAEVLPGDD